MPVPSPAQRIALRKELAGRRARLQDALDRVGPAGDLEDLLTAVDRALDEFDAGSLGICAVCGEPVHAAERERHPLSRYCLCDLGPTRLRQLESDLGLARDIQVGLLPVQGLEAAGWSTHYRYRPAGPVSGDLLDLAVGGPDGPLLFLLGDVAGKGVAAGLLMAHVSALFHEFAHGVSTPVEIVRRINAVLAARTQQQKYATLVLGVATGDGAVELVNAGHVPPLIVRPDGVRRLGSTGQPAGLFADADYDVERVRLAAGDSLLLYSDGLVEARDPGGRELGLERLEVLARSPERPPELVARILDGLVEHVAGEVPSDDTTVLVLQRWSGAGATVS